VGSRSNVPINANNLPVDPLAILGGEEANNAGNVDGLANAVVWRPCGGVNIDLVVAHLVSSWNVLLANGVVHVGLDSTWGNAVDCDLLVTGINGHAASEGLNSTLGGRVNGVLWDTLGLASDGAHQDNAASNLEVLVCLASNKELASGVDVENAVVLLWCDILHVAEGNDTGVGADNVELAEVGLGLLEHLNDLVDIGNVGLDSNGLAAHLLDLVNDFFGGLSAVGVVDDNISTALGKLESHRLSDTTACSLLASPKCGEELRKHTGTGNEGDFALQAP
jgi:hypothetical protein